MALWFGATSGYRLNVVYKLGCPATVKTTFLIGWPNELDGILIGLDDDL